MLIFRKEKRDTSKRLHPVLTKSSLIWIKLQNLTSFSKGMGKKVVCPFIIKELQNYENLRLTAMPPTPLQGGRPRPELPPLKGVRGMLLRFLTPPCPPPGGTAAS